MPKINKELLVPYNAQQMYDLVNDINKYHEFLPWCHNSIILENTTQYIIAKLDLSHDNFSSFSQSFTTKNILNKYNSDIVGLYNYKIAMSLLDGPFKYLNGTWEFKNINNKGCKVNLVLDFEFNNFILAMTLNKFFEKITSELVDSFYQRAQNIYGK